MRSRMAEGGYAYHGRQGRRSVPMYGWLNMFRLMHIPILDVIYDPVGLVRGIIL